jgi:hypothetical protein
MGSSSANSKQQDLINNFLAANPALKNRRESVKARLHRLDNKKYPAKTLKRQTLVIKRGHSVK